MLVQLVAYWQGQLDESRRRSSVRTYRYMEHQYTVSMEDEALSDDCYLVETRTSG